MPVLNFKPQFVPFILDGTKFHTIRATRKRPVKPGDRLFLYTGLRQKGAKLLREETCIGVKNISIFSSEDPDATADILIRVGEAYLSDHAQRRLAWLDGFRPPSSTVFQPGNSLDLMMQFWKDRLPFQGQIIFW